MQGEPLTLMQGNEACLRGAIAAGMRFFAGYPITPSTEIAEQAAELLPKIGGRFLQMEDEIASMAAILGASAMGMKAMTATSGPGFSLMQENIGLSSMTELPCVVVNVQRAGPSTGLPTSPAQADMMQARWGTHGDHPVIALSPSSVQECFTLIMEAFHMAERFKVPVLFMMDEIVGHLREGVCLPSAEKNAVAERPVPQADDTDWLPYRGDPETLVPVMPPFGMGWRYHITGLTHNEKGYPTNSPAEAEKLLSRLMRKLEVNRKEIIRYEETMLEDAETAVVCYGGTARAALKAVKDARTAGYKVGMFRPISIWPFPDEELAMLAGRVNRILVIEHNYGQMLLEVERAVRGECRVDFLGCVNGTALTPQQISAKLREVCNLV